MSTMENNSVTDRGSLVNDFFHSFGAFVQSHQLYPAGSPTMLEVMSDLKKVLDKCFEWRNPISLTILRERLYFEEFLIKSNLSLVSRLVDNMLERLIRKVIINKRVEDRELLVLAELFNTSPVQLRDLGGPEMMLDDRKVGNISVYELSMFFSENNEVYEADSWQAAVQKSGLDVDEVSLFMQGPDRPGYLVDVDKAGRMSVRGSRLSTNEIFQLIELLLNPAILARMILDLGTVPTEEGPMIDPSEIMRIVTRTENTLTFRSAYSEKIIGEKLGEALGLFDKNIRIAILGECLRRRSAGTQIPNMGIFRFSPEEWAESILQIQSTGEAETQFKFIKFPQSEWDRVGAGLKRLAAARGIGQDYARLEDRLRHYKIHPDRFKRQNAEIAEIANSFRGLPGLDNAQRKLADLQAKLKKHIEVGYTSTVLGLLQMQTDDNRLQQIVNNFFEQVHQLIEKEHLEAADFLTRFREVMSAKAEKNQKLIIEWMQNDGQDFIQKILGSISNIQVDKNRDALRKLIPLLRQLGHKSLHQMLDACYFDNRYATTAQIIGLVDEVRPDVLSVLELYLDADGANFSPRRFLKALSLYVSMEQEKAEPVVRKCLASSAPMVRLGTLLTLLYERNPALAVPCYREVLLGKNPAVTEDELCVAAYGLGIMGDAESAEQLRKIAEKPRKFAKGQSHELGLAALYAYAMIAGPEAQKELGKLYKKTMSTGIGGLIPWISRKKKEGA